MAFPLAEGIADHRDRHDLPGPGAADQVRRGSHRLAARRVVLGHQPMKYTTSRGSAMLIVMVMVRYGGRAAGRFTGTAPGTAIGLTIALAPAGILHPAAIVANTVAYPLGLTAARSPAGQPASRPSAPTLGPAGRAAAIALLLAAGGGPGGIAGKGAAQHIGLEPQADRPRADGAGRAVPGHPLGQVLYPLALYG